jgi:hypothetical protein
MKNSLDFNARIELAQIILGILFITRESINLSKQNPTEKLESTGTKRGTYWTQELRHETPQTEKQTPEGNVRKGPHFLT